jgi:hypothetical protein
MLGRRRGGSSSKSQEPTNTGAAVNSDTGQGAATGVSQFITQLGRLNWKSETPLNSSITISISVFGAPKAEKVFWVCP